MRRKTKRIWKGALAGAASGLAGAFAMNQFQSLLSKLQNRSGPNEEPATVKAARSLFHVDLKNKDAAGQIVHYSFGALNGAVYGALAEVSPKIRAGAGTVFGATLFAVADEALVPLLGWSKAPTAYPIASHAYGLASHLVYGVATDGVRRVLR